MIRKVGVAAMLSASLSSHVLAQSLSAENAIIAVLESNGCTAEDRTVEDTLVEQGIDEDAILVAVFTLIEARRLTVEMTDQTFTLHGGDVCPPLELAEDTSEPEARRALMALFENSDCKIDAENVKIGKVLQEQFPAEQVETAIAEMINRGGFLIDPDTKIATLTVGPVCGTKQ